MGGTREKLIIEPDNCVNSLVLKNFSANQLKICLFF